MFEFASQGNLPSTEGASEAIELLRREAELHKQQDTQKSLLGWAVSGLSEVWHQSGRSLQNVEDLSSQIEAAVKKGDQGAADELAKRARQTVEADQKSMQSDAAIDKYGSGIIKTAGLFMPGRAGYFMAGAAFTCDSIKPAESLGLGTLDAGVGLAKGLALKGCFDLIGKQNLDIAGKAISMGVTSRLAETTLSRESYLDQTGRFNALLGAKNIAENTFAPSALVSDVVTFGLAHGALGKINASTGGALTRSPLLSNMATGGVFGLSTGSVEEIKRQRDAGEGFDLSKIVSHALVTGATDMVAAIPGGKMMAANQAAAENARAGSDLARASVLRNEGDVRVGRTLSPTSMEFQLVDPSVNVRELLSRSPSSAVLTAVRPVEAGRQMGAESQGQALDYFPVVKGGRLGPQQTMLIQHSGDGLPINDALGRKADLIASCNPQDLLPGLKAKHIMTSAQSDLWLTQQGSRLRFSLMPESSASFALGTRSVSDLMLDPTTPERLRDMHDLTAFAKAMRHFKDPALRVVSGGADNVVVELANGNILKITDKPWDPEWGFREVETANGWRRIDANIIGRPQTVDMPDQPITYFIQQRAKTPVSLDHVRQFDDMIEADGYYKFWDNDFKAWGAAQLGYVPLKRGKQGLVLLDYDAVREPHLVPKNNGGKSWSAGHYLADYFSGKDR